MTSWIDRLRTWPRLPPREALLLLQAWILLAVADLALRLIPLSALLTLGRRLRVGRRHARPLNPPIARVARLVERAGRCTITQSTCLQQALVLAWILQRQGIPAGVRIGVARKDGTLTAHAWVEHQGDVIFGVSGGERYEPLSAMMTADPPG